MIQISLDFETRSEADITSVGASAYSEHPSTEVLCMGYAINDNPPQLWLPGRALPTFLTDWYSAPIRLNAWNSFFEYCIIKNVMGLEPPPITLWSDTMARASAMGLPGSLDKAANVLGFTGDEGKDSRGKKLIRTLCIPQKNTRKNIDNGDPEYYWNNDKELMSELYQYCLQDVLVERKISKKLFELHPTERKVWELDQEVNLRGIYMDLKNIDNCISIYESQSQQLFRELQELTGLENPNSHHQFLPWLRDNGYNQDNVQADTLREYLKTQKDISQKLKEAIEKKSLLSKTAPKKFYALKRRAGHDYRNRGNFTYCGARQTGRWASLGINLQNLMRPAINNVDDCIALLPQRDHEKLNEIYGGSIEAISSCIRGMLTAEPGKRLLIGDFASIESRVLSWLADEDEKVEMFRGHGKAYEYIASKIFNKPIEEITKGSDERFAGKTSELACGFQGGWRALQRMALKNSVDLDNEFCSKIVSLWRKGNPNIVKFWKSLEEAAIAAIQNPGKRVEVGVRNSIVYKVVNGTLYCQLPSGRLLCYHNPALEIKSIKYYSVGDEYPVTFIYSKVEHHDLFTFKKMANQAGSEVEEFDTYTIKFSGVDSKSYKWSRQVTYGGSLAENVTQAVARDLLAAAMLRLKDAGYHIVLHVHDEIVAEEFKGEKSIDEFLDIMKRPPEWAKDLPVEVEGEEAIRYKK